MHELMRNTWVIARREFIAYFSTPLATVFLIIFIALTGAFAFYVGGFFERGQADLAPFFQYHPWLYLLLVPAVAMRLWAEERKSGTIELLMTLPISPWEAILGKFLAAWGFIGVALLLTLPMWITVNVLGSPDNGVILASYLASWLMAGAMLSIGACISAITKNQIIAFVLTGALVFAFTAAGSPIVLGGFQGWAPEWLIHGIAQMSFLSHFSAITRGVIDLRDLVYFLSIMVAFLGANAILIDLEKAE